ncbi:MAG TPA: sulfatase-like hydrolase/transferase [Polyangiaceae bacterium]|nr:sulfatase-like hydrolase/transferase [Polyangiaceae bacterium]
MRRGHATHYAARAVALAGACTALACQARSAETAPEPNQPVTASASIRAAPPAGAPDAASGVEPFRDAALCRVDHGGMFLDLGTDASHARRSFALGPFSDVASDTWSDQSYTRVASPNVSYDFWLTEPDADVELRVRAKAGASGMLSASIDQTRLGSVRVRAESFQTLVFPKPKGPLAAGRHQLGLRWSGRSASDQRPLGMIEWIHWADAGQPAAEYRPPRQRSLRDDMVLGGVPRRSIVLETPGRLSCPVLLTRDARLELGVGYHGDGAAVARVLARRDGAPPIVLAEQRVSGKADETWTDLNLNLAPLGHQLAWLELEASGDGRNGPGRVAFSEPRIVTDEAPEPPPRAKLVVLVVASGLHRELLPPFEGTRRLRHISQLAEASARFPEYRAPTTVVGAVMATLLSGLPPLAHGLDSPKLRLGRQVLTLGDRIRETSGESAFFTGVPDTRATFGFDRGWNSFEQFSPVNDVAASAPLERAKTWLERSIALDEKREVSRLLVVHLRGGHPPWDLSRDEVAELEPKEYMGLLEARRGGMILETIRNHSRPAQRRLAPADWVRLKALQLAALEKQDQALGALIELLEREHLWNDTLFAFAGDVPMGDPPEAPFGTGRSLTEDQLLAPLWIKFPGGRFAGSEVLGPVSGVDVADTLAGALGITLPDEIGGLDLYRLAAGTGPVLARGLLATLGAEYSMRYGPWLLRGTSPRAPALCELGVDPACVHDVFDESPLAAETLWRTTFEAHRHDRTLESARGARAEPALLDKDTAAALQVWGD